MGDFGKAKADGDAAGDATGDPAPPNAASWPGAPRTPRAPAPAPPAGPPGAFTRVGESCFERMVGLKRAWVPCASLEAGGPTSPPRALLRGATKPGGAKPSTLSRSRRPGGGPGGAGG